MSLFESLQDFINDLDAGNVQCYERWDEKIGDIINYLILLDGLVQERIGELNGHPKLPMEMSVVDKIAEGIDWDYIQRKE